MKHIDKAHHIVYSFALAVAGAFLLGPVLGITGAALMGLAKEAYDATRRRFDWWDLAANAVGLVAAVMVL